MKLKKIITTLTIIFLSANLYAGYFGMGKRYYVYKKYDKAREMFLKAAEKNNIGDAYYFLGEIEKITQNFDEAEKYFKLAVSKKNTTRKFKKNAYWDLIVLAQQKNDFNGMVQYCRDMWNDLHDSSAKKKVESIINKLLWTQNKDAIAKYKEGLKYKRRGKTDKAIEKFNEAISIDNSFLAPKTDLGIIYFRKNDFSKTTEYLTPVIEKIPFYGELHLILGEIASQEKNYSGIIEHFTKALDYGFISKRTKRDITYRRGIAYFRQGNYDEALEDIQTIAPKRKSKKILILLSAIYIKQKKYNDALDYLKILYRNNPNNKIYLYKIGSLYYKLENNKFLTYFHKLFKLTKNNKEDLAKYFKAFKILSQKYFYDKNYSKTLQITKIINEENTDYDLTLISAKSNYFLKNYTKATDLFEKVSASNKDKLLLCKAYYFTGRKAKAKELLSSLLYDDDLTEPIKKDKYLKRIKSKIEKEKAEKLKKEEEENQKTESNESNSSDTKKIEILDD